MVKAGQLYVSAGAPGPLTDQAREKMARALRGESTPGDFLDKKEEDRAAD